MIDASSPTAPVALQMKEGVKRYGAVTALDGISLRVPRGECLALVGESGCGKTTLLRAFNATIRLDAGSVSVAGSPVEERDPVALRRQTGYVPQEGGLLPHWTVLRNVALVPRLLKRPHPEQSAGRALRRVGLDPEEFGSRWPRTLSGGQRQRVALARALAAEPGVVLLDEPFGALDAITRSELQREFRKLQESTRFTALLVTHDLREAFLLARRIAVMRRGRVEQAATPERLKAEPANAYVESLLRRAGVDAA